MEEINSWIVSLGLPLKAVLKLSPSLLTLASFLGLGQGLWTSFESVTRELPIQTYFC